MQRKDLGQDSLLAVVLDDGIAKAHFNFLINLVAHSLNNSVSGEMIAADDAVYPHGQGSIDPDNKIKVCCGGGFEDQCGFADGVGSMAGHRLHPLVAFADGNGMNECVQHFESGGVGEDLRRHPAAVQLAGFGAIGFRTESVDDLRAKTGILVHDTSRFLVGEGNGNIQRFEDVCDGAFAGADAAGQTNAEDG